MKANYLNVSTKLILVFCLVGMFSCSDYLEITRSDEPADPINNPIDVGGDVWVDVVITHTPSENDGVTIFSAEIVNMMDNPSLTYGFMWYDPNAIDEYGNLDITEIEVGTTQELMEYTTEVTGLPDASELVVCSFVRSEQEEVFIGNEVSF